MYCDIYIFERKFRFSFKDESNQIELGLDRLLPSPKFMNLDFDDKTGRLIFELGREGVSLGRSEGALMLGLEMRATISGPALGIRCVDSQEKICVPLRRIGVGRFELIMPRIFYNLRAEALEGL